MYIYVYIYIDMRTYVVKTWKKGNGVEGFSDLGLRVVSLPLKAWRLQEYLDHTWSLASMWGLLIVVAPFRIFGFGHGFPYYPPLKYHP